MSSAERNADHQADSPTPVVDDGLGDLTLADGPWSLSKAPSDAAFYDLGPLRIPAIPGLKARVEIDPRVGKMGAVSVQVNDCGVQLQVMAARAGKALWPQVRRELLIALKRSPGHQQVIEGRFGAELIANVTALNKATKLTHDVPIRYVGIDGDKWMIRAVVRGPSVLTDATIARVDALLSRIAVERGSGAHAEGEVLELAPPMGEVDQDRWNAMVAESIDEPAAPEPS